MRERAKTIVCTSLARKLPGQSVRLQQRASAAMPSSWCTSGGLYSAKTLRAAGAPFSSISVRSSAPVTRTASSRGLAIVADAQMNCGLEP